MFRAAMCPSSGELLYQCDTRFMSLCVEFYSKIKFEKSVHLVDFVIRIYKHIFRIRTTYCFPTATKDTRTRVSIMLYVHCLSHYPLLLSYSSFLNPLNAELNPTYHLLALLAHHIFHVSMLRVNFPEVHPVLALTPRPLSSDPKWYPLRGTSKRSHNKFTCRIIP